MKLSKKILLIFLFTCFGISVSQSQLIITSSGNVNLGTFVKGGIYSLDSYFNEITFTITCFDSVKREHTVILHNIDSETESDNGIKINTEWIVNTNTPFINGAEYSFKNRLKVKVRVKSILVPENCNSGKGIEFKPRLLVEEVRY